MFKSTSIAVIAALAVGPAFAAGPTPVVVEPVIDDVVYIAPSTDWTGFYAGLTGGVGDFSNGSETSDTSMFGAQVGYLRDMGTFVIGSELAYVKTDYDASDTVTSDSLRLKGIAGYDAGNFLPYGFLGVSRFDIDVDGGYSDTAAIYGVGAKFAMTESLTLGAEYLVERKDNFDDSFDLDSSELGLRVDFHF
jgi:outer membrane immunogenic protein